MDFAPERKNILLKAPVPKTVPSLSVPLPTPLVSHVDRSKEPRLAVFSKALSIVMTFEAFQPVTLIVFAPAPAKAFSSVVRLLVFHVCRSSTGAPQSEKAKLISVTFCTSQPATFSAVKPLQCEKILCSVVTLEVFQPETSSIVSALQPWNIPLGVFRLLVFQLPRFRLVRRLAL